ncbi:MAG: hypothetical protein ACKO2K_13050 [Alphaproteobacteria bacterium]
MAPLGGTTNLRASGALVVAVAIAAVAAVATVALPRAVEASPESIACGLARQKASVDLSRRHAGCHRRVGFFQPADDCVASEMARFDEAASAIATLPGCLALPAGFDLRDEAIGAANRFAAALAPGATPPRDRCARSKLAAAMRDYRSVVRCHREATLSGGSAGACLDDARTIQHAAFAAAEARGGCPTTGDRDSVHHAVLEQARWLRDSVSLLDCADEGGAPTCGGPCASGAVCRPTGEGSACACEPAPCLGSAPACGAACPDGGTCAARFNAAVGTVCECVYPEQPCGDTYPLCGGTCPAGTHCGTTSTGDLGGSCGCVPEGSVACSDAGGFPTCGGACPDGTTCAGVDFQVGAFFHTSGCICGSPQACTDGGITCPPGQFCQGGIAPGFSFRLCRQP